MTSYPKLRQFFIINSEVQNLIKSNYIVTVGNSLRQRVFARISLDYPDASHLHFGNLPPIFSKSENVSIYIQNSLLVDKWSVLKRERWPLKLRITLERIFIFLFMRKNIVLLFKLFI